ncbi:MAG TPA: hypothetical protein VHD86_23420 [Xanthobacteraceae bacterium]|nr:hypothetical protein [Xanthobacteraceae bacterium]
MTNLDFAAAYFFGGTTLKFCALHNRLSGRLESAHFQVGKTEKERIFRAFRLAQRLRSTPAVGPSGSITMLNRERRSHAQHVLDRRLESGR